MRFVMLAGFLLAESFSEQGISVVYDSADVAARDRLVKLPLTLPSPPGARERLMAPSPSGGRGPG